MPEVNNKFHDNNFRGSIDKNYEMNSPQALTDSSAPSIMQSTTPSQVLVLLIQVVVLGHCM